MTEAGTLHPMATIRLTPATATTGQIVQVAGSGFHKRRSITITYASTATSVLSGYSGAFATTIKAPSTAGAFTVRATDGTTSATAQLGVSTPAPAPTPTGPTIPAGATVLLVDTFAAVGLDATTWNSPSKYHCCGTPTTKTGGLVAGYAGPVRVPGDGFAYLDAIRDSSGHWQVPIIDTQGKVAFRAGCHVEVRAKIPVGRGVWPAVLWFYGQGSIDEIDANETLANPIGTAPSTNPTYDVRYDRVHVHSRYNASAYEHHAEDATGSALSDAFHLYGVDWLADHVTFYLDGLAIGTFNPTDKSLIPAGPLDGIINLGISNGQDWGGNLSADASTPSPSTLVLDYVAAWRLP